MVRIKTSPSQTSAQETAHLLRRLFVLMTRQLTLLEARHKNLVSGSTTMTSADSEKDVRTLGSLTRQLEKIIELESTLVQRHKGEGANQHELNPQQLRTDLTRRLEGFAATQQPDEHA